MCRPDIIRPGHHTYSSWLALVPAPVLMQIALDGSYATCDFSAVLGPESTQARAMASCLAEDQIMCIDVCRWDMMRSRSVKDAFLQGMWPRVIWLVNTSWSCICVASSEHADVQTRVKWSDWNILKHIHGSLLTCYDHPFESRHRSMVSSLVLPKQPLMVEMWVSLLVVHLELAWALHCA